MKRVLIVSEKCNGCDVCQLDLLCENRVVIRENPADKPWVDFYRCRGCMKCLNYCPHGAIEELVQPCHNMERKMGW